MKLLVVINEGKLVRI